MASSAPSATGAGGQSGTTEPLAIEQDEVTQLKTSLQREKAAKRKMYTYLVKIADELKTLRGESEQLIHASEYARKAWYEGGMWRGPNVLPGAAAAGLNRQQIGSPNNAAVASASSAGGGGAPSSSSGNPGEGAMGGIGGIGGPALVPRAPVSLSDLFLDIVT